MGGMIRGYDSRYDSRVWFTQAELPSSSNPRAPYKNTIYVYIHTKEGNLEETQGTG